MAWLQGIHRKSKRGTFRHWKQYKNDLNMSQPNLCFSFSTTLFDAVPKCDLLNIYITADRYVLNFSGSPRVSFLVYIIALSDIWIRYFRIFISKFFLFI